MTNVEVGAKAGGFGRNDERRGGREKCAASVEMTTLGWKLLKNIGDEVIWGSAEDFAFRDAEVCV
jgi:hypothetical protein